ncbi:hypothetical protein D7S92_39860 [Burkholderia contaminans]|nr:hypothetical protein [Burkholderia contaminans]MBA9910544.1 hypothetical protein [Burkholderia contaminans]
MARVFALNRHTFIRARATVDIYTILLLAGTAVALKVSSFPFNVCCSINYLFELSRVLRRI